MSLDLRFVAFGGTANEVVVLNGLTGVRLFGLPTAGTVWALGLTNDSGSLAIGGEAQPVSVIDTRTHREVVQLPVRRGIAVYGSLKGCIWRAQFMYSYEYMVRSIVTT